jgi:hypothetical protein
MHRSGLLAIGHPNIIAPGGLGTKSVEEHKKAEQDSLANRMRQTKSY